MSRIWIPPIALLFLFGASRAALASGSTAALAEEEEFCPEAFIEATEHTCLHAESGPFQTVTAASTVETALANINVPHVAYTVNLQPVSDAFQGAVVFQATETADHLFFTAPDVTVSIFDSSFAEVVPELGAAVDPEACSLLSRYTMFHLEEGVLYRVFFGPTNEPAPTVLIEHIDEFAGVCQCEPIDLTAARNYCPTSWEDAEMSFEEHIRFPLPAEIPVTQGNSGNFRTVLTFLDEESGAEIDCHYRGAANVPFPVTPGELARATRYLFESCDDGSVAGDEVETSYLRLHVTRGGNIFPWDDRTEVQLVIEPECGHDHEDEE